MVLIGAGILGGLRSGLLSGGDVSVDFALVSRVLLESCVQNACAYLLLLSGLAADTAINYNFAADLRQV